MKNIKFLMQNVLTLLSRNTRPVYAEETVGGTPPAQASTTPAQSAPTINYETLIAEARKQEKDKLYPEIERLKGENKLLVEKMNAILLQSGEKDLQVRDLTNQLESAGKSKVTPEEIKTLNDTIKAKDAEILRLTNEINSGKLESFKKAKIAEYNGEVIEDMITGNTEEELTASIERAKNAYQAIASKFAGQAQVVQQQAQQAFQTIPPVVNPNNNVAQFNMQNSTPEQIASMTREQWAEYRKTMGLK